MTFSPEQLNFSKFTIVVLDVFPVALRCVFASMWDTYVASPPGIPEWDDSVTVLNLLHAKEGGVKKVPSLNKSYKEWDCTALFKATLFAQTFAVPDGTGGLSTLDKLYVRPRGLSAGAFHPSVISPTGDQAETYALALDQLRLLRNTLCHQNNTQSIDKATFDNYIMLAKDAFTALGQDSTRIDDIGMMGEDEFPTAKQQQLEDALKKEKDAAIEFKQIDDHLTKIELQVKDVGSDVKDVKTEVTDVKTQVKDVGSDVKDVKTEITDVKTQVKDVGLDVKDVKNEVTDVKTQVGNVGADVKELKKEVVGIKQTLQEGNSKGPLVTDSCIPERIPHFVGRQLECRLILNHIINASTRVIDIWGPPGFGKTSVAINVAHRLREMKFSVFFTGLRGMRRKDDLVSKLLSIFADTKQVPHPHISASDWLIHCLQLLKNPFVLILDNADDLLESGDSKLRDDILRFVDEIVSRCSHIKLLLTTRESLDYSRHKNPIHLLRVDKLDDFSSSCLVRGLVPNVSEHDCKIIVKECGQVPLAMRLMCSTIREGNVSVDELLEEIKITPLVEVLDNESFSEDVRLKTMINTSFQRLPADERDAFVSLAVFPGYFGTEEATAVLNFKRAFQTKKMMQSLERKSLIIRNEFEDFSFAIHSLLRSFIDEKRNTDDEIESVFKAAEHRFYDYHISYFQIAKDKFLTGYSLEGLTLVFQHKENIILSLVHGITVDKLYPKAVEVLSKAELFLHFVLSAEESLFQNLYDIAVKEAKKRQNLVDEHNLLAAKSFAHWGWFSKDRQTLEHSVQYASYSNTPDCTAKTLCYHGVYQLLYGKVDEGISLLKSAVDRLSSCCDEVVLKVLSYKVLAGTYRSRQDHKMASHFQNLYITQSKATSRYVEYSLILHQDAFPISEDAWKNYFRCLGEDGFFFGLTAKLLAYALVRKVSLASVEEVWNSLNKVVETMYKDPGELGKNCWTVFAEIENMVAVMAASLEADPNVNPDALAFNKKAWRLLMDFVNHLRSEDSLAFLGSCKAKKLCIEELLHQLETLIHVFGPRAGGYTAFSKFLVEICKDGLENHEDDAMIIAAIQGEYDHEPAVDFEDLAKCYDKLGTCQHLTEDYNGAIESYQQAIRKREENIGNHVDTASSLTNIGCVYFKMNNEIEGIRFFKSALELRKQLGVYDHVDTSNIYHTLGENYCTLGNQEKAMEAHLQALELRKKQLGEHSLVAESFNGIGVVHYKMGNYQSAIEQLQNAVDLTMKLLGKHEQTANSCHNLALAYLALGRYPEALEFCQQALSMRPDSEFWERVGTIKSFYMLGRIHVKMGDKNSAEEAFKKSLQINNPFVHELAARSYHWLGKVQIDLGNLNGALQSLNKASRIRKEFLGDHPDTAKTQKLLNCVYETLSGNELDCD